MTITITANNKTITIEVPEIEGQDVKVSAPENITAPVVKLASPQKKKSAPPPKSGRALPEPQKFRTYTAKRSYCWYSKKGTTFISSPDRHEVARNKPLAEIFGESPVMIVPCDNSFEGRIAFGWMGICKTLFNMAAHIEFIDIGGRCVVEIREISGITKRFEIRLLTSGGLRYLRANDVSPESCYHVWSNPYSTMPCVVSKLLAA